MQTQTCGERFGPPDVRTAVGAADFAERTVVVSLSNRREAEMFIESYHRMGWRALYARRTKNLVAILATENVALVVTDRMLDLRIARITRRDERAPTIHFVSNDATVADAAWATGAEAIMVRSISHDDFFSYDVVERPD